MTSAANGTVATADRLVETAATPALGGLPVTAPFVPEDAPFSPAQRQWLNGFLSGLTVLARAARGGEQASAGPAVDAPPITILYGSQSGNAEALSKQLKKRAAAAGFSPEIASLDSFDRSTLASVKRLLIVASTYGEGDPPDNAKAFSAWIASDEAPSLGGLEYSVCALGDRNYTHFCKCGRDIDERLAELGAARISDRVECDVDFDEDYEGWVNAVFASPALASAGGAAANATDTGEETAVAGPAWSKKSPFPATLLRTAELNGPGSSKDIRHVEISLAGSGLVYEPGDALGVVPVNCRDMVDELLRALGLPSSEIVEVKGETRPLRHVLLRERDICSPTHAAAEALGLPGLPPADDNAAFRAWVEDRHVIDLVLEAKSRPDPQAFVDALRPLQPRLYSISSSPKAHPGEVHLTVGVVRYECRGRARRGVASTFFADRCPDGGLVGVYVNHSPHFHLPADDVPLIMIGPGTGVAPFRAFLEERERRGSTAKNWLFFGDRNAATDFIYKDEIEGMLSRGTLTHLDTAWSRDAAQKVYVQDRMREHGDRLYDWLEEGAAVYVCGDASRMAPDVEAALLDVIKARGGKSDDGAGAYLADLASSHRYQRDVY